MMSPRHLARENAVQALYLYEVNEYTSFEELEEFWTTIEDQNDDIINFSRELVAGTLGYLETANQQIEKHLQDWKLDRVSPVTKAILRVSIFEMIISQETPHQVVINEAVELAKDFVGEKIPPFVNKILQTIYDESKANK